jgi:hypothetical protein
MVVGWYRGEEAKQSAIFPSPGKETQRHSSFFLLNSVNSSASQKTGAVCKKFKTRLLQCQSLGISRDY